MYIEQPQKETILHYSYSAIKHRKMADTDVAVVAAKAFYFKWCPATELMFARAAFSNRAFIRTRETFDVKWLRVRDDLLTRSLFSEQGFQLKSGSLSSKLNKMLDAYSKSHEIRNLSALPDIDDMSALDSLLKDMNDAIAKLGEECLAEKNNKKQKKRVISDVTDIMQSGGATVKTGLSKLAQKMTDSDEPMLSASVGNFAKGLTEVTVERSKKKRDIKASEMEESQLMLSFGAMIKNDQLSADARLKAMEDNIIATNLAVRESAASTAALVSAITMLHSKMA